MFAGGAWEACIKRLQGEAQWHDPHIFCPDPFAANLKGKVKGFTGICFNLLLSILPIV